jgi:hypothetical protein
MWREFGCLIVEVAADKQTEHQIISGAQETLVVVIKYMTWKTRGFNPLLHNPPSVPLTPSKYVE